MDDIYAHLEGEDGNIGRFLELQRQKQILLTQQKDLVVESTQRPARSLDVMEQEASKLSAEMEQD